MHEIERSIAAAVSSTTALAVLLISAAVLVGPRPTAPGDTRDRAGLRLPSRDRDGARRCRRSRAVARIPEALEEHARFGACSAFAPKTLDTLLEEVFGSDHGVGAPAAP